MPSSRHQGARGLFFSGSFRANIRLVYPQFRKGFTLVSTSILALDVEKLSRDWQWVLECLREVISQSGEKDIARLLPMTGGSPVKIETDEAIESPRDNVRLTQAYSIAFQLLSMAEQNASVQFRREVETACGLSSVPALWGESLQTLIEQGWTAEEIAKELPSIQVELVLTAHPTEAKRATVLAHHRRLFERFVARDRTDLPPGSYQDNDDTIRSLIAILWRTGEIYLDKPDLQSERRNVIDYLTKVFPATIRPLDIRLRQAWKAAGLEPAVLSDPLKLPRLTFGTWIGGDRDGHPLVTAEVTRESLAEMRSSALSLLQRELLSMARMLSLSAYWIQPTPDFLQRIAERAEQMGAVGRTALLRNPNEPWRQFVNLMIAQLPKSSAASDSSRTTVEPTKKYARAAELLEDLQVLYKSLVAVGQASIADYAVQPLMRLVQSFGFHLAILDIRQNSQWHDTAVEQLLASAGIVRTDYSTWSESDRVSFLNDELSSRRPFSLPDATLGKEADAVLAVFRVIKETIQKDGPDGLGALIVSMTRSVSDLLVVYLFAREVGLLEQTEDGPVCPLPVVPLFETITDLENSPAIYEGFLSNPLTRRSLAAIQRRRGDERPVGQIMIGYSDSNKDGGIVASLIGLRRGQSALTEVGNRHGVRVRFFHGRGGTISRGAGPTHRFIKALPDKTLQGDLRLTEQGETIAQKYAHQPTAIYNLELFLAGTMRKSLSDRRENGAAHPLEGTLDRLATWARDEYTRLLHSDGFVTFFRQATPIDAIEQSRIGSRPSRRSGQSSLKDLRAIPWVFAWGQSRFYLSGWYGIGSALKRLEQQSPEAIDQMKEQLLTWAPLHYLVSNVATSATAVDVVVMQQYADLVEDKVLRNRIMGFIENELTLTRDMMQRLYGGPLMEQRPNVQRMIELRSDGLRILHRQQIELLKTWRAYMKMGETAQAESMTPRLLLTVNAIASGLGTTG